MNLWLTNEHEKTTNLNKLNELFDPGFPSLTQIIILVVNNKQDNK